MNDRQTQEAKKLADRLEYQWSNLHYLSKKFDEEFITKVRSDHTYVPPMIRVTMFEHEDAPNTTFIWRVSQQQFDEIIVPANQAVSDTFALLDAAAKGKVLLFLPEPLRAPLIRLDHTGSSCTDTLTKLL